MFANRVRELQFLSRMFARPGAQFVVLWGRRRVGKTSLLQQFARGRRLLYHLGTQATERLILEGLSARAAEFFQDPLLVAQPLTSWEAALAYLCDRAEREPWGLILDEFPYLVESAPRLPSLLQVAWDQRLKETGLKLVVCGSSVAMMESTFLSPRSPLYGRRTGQWKLEPFELTDLGRMVPHQSLVELVELYCVVGGMPMYASRFDPRAALLDNVRDHILTRGELLYEEVPFLLKEELREPRVYQSVLAVMAGGARKFSELSSKTGLDRAHLTGYLATLAELGLIAREVPVTEPNPQKSRRGQYLISDPFVRFWYRFVFPNLSRLESGDLEGVLQGDIAPRFHDYVSLHLEQPLAPLVRRGPLRSLAPFEPAVVGRHWSASEEFDLVALDGSRSQALVAEVKWSRRPVPPSVGVDLVRRIEQCQALRGVRVLPVVLSRNGFSGKAASSQIQVDLSQVSLRASEP